jgi:cytochrome P450
MTSAVSGALPLYPPTIPPLEQSLGMASFLFRVLRNPLLTLPRAAYEERLAITHRPGSTIVWVSEPALVEEVLLTNAADFEKTPMEKRVFAATLRDGVLTSESKLWRWQRRSMAPMFRHGDILRYVPAMAAAADDQIGRWRASPPGVAQKLDHDMTETTFDIIARTMLTGGLPAEAETIKRATAYVLSHIGWEIAYGLVRFPTWMPHPAMFGLRRTARQLRGAVGSIIARRKADAGSGGDGEDLLDRLLAARDPDSGAPMDDERLVSNLLTLLEAGHETTSRALTWTLYLLARAPEWQERLRAEVRAVVGDGPITAEHLTGLQLTQQVLKEAMRLYPAVPFVSRVATRQTEIGGETVPAGAMIMMSIYAIHRHRQLWNDPDRFDPTRFAPEREAAYPRCQFMPFGAGPRICLGAAFAMVEATVVLASFLRSARFEWDGEHEPHPISRVTLQPTGGMPLRVTVMD